LQDKAEPTRRAAVFVMVLEVAQLLVFVLNPRFPWGNAVKEFVQQIRNLQLQNPLVSLGYTAYLTVFWVLAAILLTCFGICFYVAYSFRENKFTLVWPIIFVRQVVALFITSLFTSSLNVFLTAFDCLIVGQARPMLMPFGSVTDASGAVVGYTIACWDMPHAFTAVAGIVMSVAFSVFALLVSLVDFEPNLRSSNPLASADPRAEGMLFVAKTALAVAAALLSSYTLVLAIVFSVASAMMMYTMLWLLPYREAWVNRLRCGFFSVLTFSSFVLVAVVLLDDPSSNALVLLEGAGALPAFGLGWLLVRWRERGIDGRRMLIDPASRAQIRGRDASGRPVGPAGGSAGAGGTEFFTPPAQPALGGGGGGGGGLVAVSVGGGATPPAAASRQGSLASADGGAAAAAAIASLRRLRRQQTMVNTVLRAGFCMPAAGSEGVGHSPFRAPDQVERATRFVCAVDREYQMVDNVFADTARVFGSQRAAAAGVHGAAGPGGGAPGEGAAGGGAGAGTGDSGAPSPADGAASLADVYSPAQTEADAAGPDAVVRIDQDDAQMEVLSPGGRRASRLRQAGVSALSFGSQVPWGGAAAAAAQAGGGRGCCGALLAFLGRVTGLGACGRRRGAPPPAAPRHRRASDAVTHQKGQRDRLLRALLDSDAIFRHGLGVFADSAPLHLAYASFLLAYGSRESESLAKFHIDRARRLNTSFQDRFIIFLRDTERKHQVQGEAVGESNMDLVSYVEFQNNMEAAITTHRAMLKAMRRFWKMVALAAASVARGNHAHAAAAAARAAAAAAAAAAGGGGGGGVHAGSIANLLVSRRQLKGGASLRSLGSLRSASAFSLDTDAEGGGFGGDDAASFSDGFGSPASASVLSAGAASSPFAGSGGGFGLLPPAPPAGGGSGGGSGEGGSGGLAPVFELPPSVVQALSTAFTRIDTLETKVKSIYGLLLDKYPRSVKLLRAYASFSADVLDDRKKAGRLNAEAARLEEMQRDVSRYAQLGGGAGAPAGAGGAQAGSANMVDPGADGLVVINDQGIMTSISKSACKLFGYHEKEVAGRNVSVLMGPPHAAQHNAYITNYLSTGISHVIGTRRRVEARHKDGHMLPIELSVNQVRGAARRSAAASAAAAAALRCCCGARGWPCVQLLHTPLAGGGRPPHRYRCSRCRVVSPFRPPR
jgi:PAS domain S-box-containing protein